MNDSFPFHEKALRCQPKFLGLGFDCVPSFSSESLQQAGRGSVTG